jgi:methyl-accepting chemotaxis protein
MTAGSAGQGTSIRKRRGKVLYQLLFLCLVIGIGPLVISSRKLMNINQRTIESGILNSHTQLAAATADNVEAFLGRVRESLEGISRFQGMVKGLDSGQRQNILIHFLDSYDYFQGLKVLDAGGAEVSDVSRSGAQRLWEEMGERGRKAAFERAMEGSVYVGYPFTIEGADHSFMSIAVPLRSEVGAIRGVFLATVSLESLQTLISRISIGGSGQAYLVDSRGRVVAHRDVELVRSRENLSDLEIVGNYLQAGQTVGSVPFRDREGREMLGAYDFIDSVKWGVVIEQLRDEAYHSLQEMRRQTVVWVVLSWA